jgi:hypothetical protein
MKTYIRNRNPPSFFVGTKDTTVCCVIHNKKLTLTFAFINNDISTLAFMISLNYVNWRSSQACSLSIGSKGSTRVTCSKTFCAVL